MFRSISALALTAGWFSDQAFGFYWPPAKQCIVYFRSCLFVYLFVFRKPWHKKIIFVHLQGIQAVFVYEGHQITGTKKVKNLYYHNVELW